MIGDPRPYGVYFEVGGSPRLDLSPGLWYAFALVVALLVFALVVYLAWNHLEDREYNRVLAQRDPRNMRWLP